MRCRRDARQVDDRLHTAPRDEEQEVVLVNELVSRDRVHYLAWNFSNLVVAGGAISPDSLTSPLRTWEKNTLDL